MSTTTHPTDQAALLASVLAAPDDDGVRLIYADWLDEHGQGERAEFIRVQCELARLNSDPDERRKLDPKKGVFHNSVRGGLDFEPTPAMKVRDALRERERALTRLHVQNWIPPIEGLAVWTHFARGHVPKYGWLRKEAGRGAEEVLAVFRRGFVARVECPLAAFLDGPCERCGGTGTVGAADGSYEIGCPDCSGTGRTPGIAAALFSAQPVTEVRLSDRVPAEHVSSIDTRTYPHRRPFWYVGSQVGINEQERHWIPPEIGRLIVGDTTPGGPNAVYFDSADAAHAALSAGAVRYGRKLAGVG